MEPSKLAYILKNLDERKKQYLLQLIPINHELWLAGVLISDPKEFLQLVKETLDETIPKPSWAAEALHIIDQ